MEIRDDYKFLRINDAFKTLHLNVNLIGVVIELGFPTGTDCSCTLKIVDPSRPVSGLPVKLFARTFEALPRVRSMGDIILLSRVKMVLFNREMTAVFKDGFSSFALFKGKDGDDFVPYQSSPAFQMREHDKNFISNLREWLVTYKFDEGSYSFTSLKDVKEGEYSNLSCLIVHISKDNKDRWIIFVWDGTDTPPCSILAKSDRLPLYIEPKPLLKNVLRNFPTVGSVLRVIIDKVGEKQAIHSLKPGQPVKFLNLLFQVNSGLWSAVFTPSTKMEYATNEEKQALKHRRMYGEIFSSGRDTMLRCAAPSHSGITGVSHEDTPFVTLMDILTYHTVTAKFRCVVRVVAVYPWDVNKFRDSKGKYKVLFMLEDATARICASVYADEGKKFFGGELSDEVLVQKLNRLLGLPGAASGNEIKDLPRNPPWVQCCLFSFYNDKKDEWGTRKFRIFDTWITG